MSLVNNTDRVLKVLYDRRAYNGLVPIISKLNEHGYKLTIEELKEIKEKLVVTRFAVFKNENKLNELDGTITQTGIDFVQKNSFTTPGTSILKII